jgi:hypothetical protein
MIAKNAREVRWAPTDRLDDVEMMTALRARIVGAVRALLGEVRAMNLGPELVEGQSHQVSRSERDVSEVDQRVRNVREIPLPLGFDQLIELLAQELETKLKVERVEETGWLAVAEVGQPEPSMKATNVVKQIGHAASPSG